MHRAATCSHLVGWLLFLAIPRSRQRSSLAQAASAESGADFARDSRDAGLAPPRNGNGWNFKPNHSTRFHKIFHIINSFARSQDPNRIEEYRISQIVQLGRCEDSGCLTVRRPEASRSPSRFHFQRPQKCQGGGASWCRTTRWRCRGPGARGW